MTKNGYNDYIPVANNALINGFAFGGNSQGWIESVANLSLFAGQNVLIRFRFASDVLTPGVGWWVDDVYIGQDFTQVHNTAEYDCALGSGTASASVIVVNPQSQPLLDPANQIELGATAPDRPFSVTAFPNPAQQTINLRLEGAIGKNYELRMTDMNGKLIRQSSIQMSNATTLQIDTYNMTNGMYLISLIDKEDIHTIRVMIQKN